MAPPLRAVSLVPYLPEVAPEHAARAFYETMKLRRSVRDFSDRDVSEETIRWCIAAAGTAPSGANKQPWRFVAVRDPAVKHEIRVAAEAEEREFYERRATPEWLADLEPLGTDPDKSFLERAPWLIVVFKMMKTDPVPVLAPPPLAPAKDGEPRLAPPQEQSQPHVELQAQAHAQGETQIQDQTYIPSQTYIQGKVYYVEESVGIATGMLIAAIHQAGLVTLTHTPSPMGFLARILGRPAHERAFLLLPVGYPAPGCVVPDIARKPLHEIMIVR
jgi:iodotyrosine deiodinase